MSDIIIPDSLTLVEIAKCPQNYQPEVKAAALDTIKKIKSSLRDIEVSIQSNVIHDMIVDSATKILFVDTQGENHVLTLKSPAKVINRNIQDVEKYVCERGFPNLVETKVVPIAWSIAKELKKQGGEIAKVIDAIYVDDTKKLEIK